MAHWVMNHNRGWFEVSDEDYEKYQKTHPKSNKNSEKEFEKDYKEKQKGNVDEFEEEYQKSIEAQSIKTATKKTNDYIEKISNAENINDIQAIAGEIKKDKTMNDNVCDLLENDIAKGKSEKEIRENMQKQLKDNLNKESQEMRSQYINREYEDYKTYERYKKQKEEKQSKESMEDIKEAYGDDSVERFNLQNSSENKKEKFEISAQKKLANKYSDEQRREKEKTLIEDALFEEKYEGSIKYLQEKEGYSKEEAIRILKNMNK